MKKSYPPLLIVVGLTLSAKADLIGHWKFDEGTGAVATDSSTAGNDGAIFEATWGSDEVFDSYLIFDGDNDQVDPEVALPVMTMTNDFTWAVWFNSQAVATGSQNNSIIIGNRVALDGNDSSPRQFIKLTARNFEWHQNDNGNDNLDFEDFLPFEWHHVAVVKTGAELEFFLDGVSTQTQSLTESIGTEENPFLIGGHERAGAANTHNEFFNGYIADVRIYDEALSAAAVEAVYLENAPVEAGPAELAITDITRNTANDIELTWGSDPDPDRKYSLEFSTELTQNGQPGGWEEIVDAIPTAGASTSYTLLSSVFPPLNTEEKLFFRIKEEEPVVAP